MSLDRRLDLAKNQPEPNIALREIGGRISKLSFRDMLDLAETIRGNLSGRTVLDSTMSLANALLSAADDLGRA